MKREIYIHKSKIADSDKSFDLAYWLRQTPEARISAVEQIRQEYHQWEYGKEPVFRKVIKIVKRK